MQLSSKRAAALMMLLCLSGISCSRSRDAATGGRTLLSPAPSPQNANAGPQNENAGPKVESPLPRPTGFVNDYANVFDGESEERLESALKELRDKSDVEFAVVTVETTGGRPIFEYSLAVAKGWGIGPEETSKGGGLLLMLATKDHEWRLQVSRNLEKDLPDAECRRLARESLKLYREGKYAEGLTNYAGALVARLEEARGFKLSSKLGDKR
ncbi:MAG TPA: TPM domain-containing protein [Pyrinomonadaceae bacterium]|nr:TPM domain-containing protein [Pyrinomonadaceae bacterium]